MENSRRRRHNACDPNYTIQSKQVKFMEQVNFSLEDQDPDPEMKEISDNFHSFI